MAGLGGMDPAMMARMQQALMQDPELLQIMQRPETMAKLQQLMSNPQAAMSMMNDPEMFRLFTKVQALMAGGGGGFGGGGGASVGGFGGGGGGGGGGGDDSIAHVRSLADFQQRLQAAGDKPVVVDFFTTWCGPCKAIAPAFAEEARAHRGEAVFLKVDCDQCRDVANHCGVEAFPTFQFFVGGKMVDALRGANEAELRRLISKHAAAARDRPSPYRHFPLRETEQVTFRSCKWDMVKAGLLKLLEQIPADFALTAAEHGALDAVAAKLDDAKTYHSTSFSEAEYAAVDKLLRWPADSAATGLHYARMLALHPAAADNMARRMTGEETRITTRIARIAAECTKPATLRLCLQALANMFARRVLAKLMPAQYEPLIETLLPAAQRVGADAKVRGELIAVLVNFALLFLEDAAKFHEAKVHLVSSAKELLAAEDDGELAYRLVVVLGSLLYRDAACKEIARALDLAEAARDAAKRHAAHAQLNQAAEELLKCLAAGAEA
jgi:thioredoxin 1